MRKITWALTLVLATLTLGYSQNYTFRVLATKGVNEVKTGGVWQPVKTGATLQEADEIKVSENAYLGLVHKSGKPIEIKKAGPYKVDELAKSVNTESSVLNKYTDFILSSNSADTKKNRLSATGAVHRGEGDAINLLLPDNQFAGFYGKKVTLSWESKVKGPFVVELQDMFEDVLAKYETNSNTFTIDLADPKLAGKDLNAIMILVSQKDVAKNKSSVKILKRLSAEEERKVKAAFAELPPLEEGAMSKLILAGFYDQQNLVVDALTAYQEAILLEPEVPAYKEYLEDFMIRRNIKAPKQQ
ncbi:MAG: hypothetical protein LW821_14820 [Flammeovirgaceae bacterium]|jgi:hypothetical protein|nr:hypothetical protein [Flammeovirgaceae bacterium]